MTDAYTVISVGPTCPPSSVGTVCAAKPEVGVGTGLGETQSTHLSMVRDPAKDKNVILLGMGSIRVLTQEFIQLDPICKTEEWAIYSSSQNCLEHWLRERKQKVTLGKSLKLLEENSFFYEELWSRPSGRFWHLETRTLLFLLSRHWTKTTCQASVSCCKFSLMTTSQSKNGVFQEPRWLRLGLSTK